MGSEVQVDLNTLEKETMLEYGDFVITNKETLAELKCKRRKWIRFSQFDLEQVIGELCYHLKSTDNDAEFYLLDALIAHLEYYLND